MPETGAPRIVMITGAGSGIGLATARAFAALGDLVVVTDVDAHAAERVAAVLGGDCVAFQLDVSNESAVVAVIAEVAARFGRIDVLVNNAGIVDARAQSAIEISAEDIRRLVSVNLEGAYLAAREVGRVMIARGGGAIVNLSSGAALRALPNRATYSLTKAAILGLTRTLASEWGLAGIRVNAVLPGYVATEILESLAREGRFDRAAVERAIPLGRLADPAEIAAAIIRVAGATYMTGAAVTVDGGTDAFGGPAVASESAAPALSGRGVAIVTGGVTGIGAAIAARLASERSVVILDRDPAGIAALPPGQSGMVVDIADPHAVEAAIDAIAAQHGAIAMLVNNAGVADAFEPTIKQNLVDFRRVFDVNLTGALIAARTAARHMQGSGGGAIVNLSSIAASGGLPRRNAYCAAKAAVTMLTRSLACEWAPLGIRVAAVAPGYIATPGVRALESSGKRNMRAIRRRIPMGRLGTPDEIAEIVCFLTSPDASYITGSIWAVDGGWSAYGDAGAAAAVD